MKIKLINNIEVAPEYQNLKESIPEIELFLKFTQESGTIYIELIKDKLDMINAIFDNTNLNLDPSQIQAVNQFQVFNQLLSPEENLIANQFNEITSGQRFYGNLVLDTYLTYVPVDNPYLRERKYIEYDVQYNFFDDNEVRESEPSFNEENINNSFLFFSEEQGKQIKSLRNGKYILDYDIVSQSTTLSQSYDRFPRGVQINLSSNGPGFMLDNAEELGLTENIISSLPNLPYRPLTVEIDGNPTFVSSIAAEDFLEASERNADYDFSYTDTEKLNKSKNPFVQSLLYKVLKKRYQESLINKNIDFNAIIDESKGQYGTLCYEIVKNRNNYSQSIFLPCSSTLMSYYDNQVKYDVDYNYEVYAYYIVDFFSYELNPQSDYSELFRSGRVELNPDVKIEPTLIKVPVSKTFRTKVLDAPPAKPELSIRNKPLKNSNIIVSFNGSLGDQKERYVSLQPQDESYINDFVLSRNLGRDSIISFQEERDIAGHEMYLLDKEPTSYSDFQNGILRTFDTASFGPNPSTEFSLQTNQKYYIVGRTFDIHQNMSNPSLVYEVEIIEQDEVYRMMSRPFHVGQNQEDFGTKTMSRFIHIKPSIEQLILNVEKSNINQNTIAEDYDPALVKLGVDENVIWNKEYILSCTSKQTGRKINFRYKCVTEPEREN